MSTVFDNEKFNQFQSELDNITIQFLKHKQSQSSLQDTISILDNFFTVERDNTIAQYELALDKMLETNKVEPIFSHVFLSMQLQECVSIYNQTKTIFESYKRASLNDINNSVPENYLPSFMPTLKNYTFKQ